jgi:hypothetical protein
MKTSLKIIVLLFMAILLSNCSSTNKYMIKDTDEYSKITAKFIGDWGVDQYTVDGENQLKSKYEKISANFDFLTKTVKLNIWVAEGTIADKLLDWKKEFPGIKVNEYKITYTANWEVTFDGENLVLSNANTDLVIKGDGENFDGFYQWEKSKFNMAKSVDDGSLIGSALGSLTQAATGTSDLFPEIEDSYKIYSVADDGSKIKLMDDNNIIELVK